MQQNQINNIRKKYINLADPNLFSKYHKTEIGSDYFYPRHSSKSRILINSAFSALAAFSFGLGRAIYKNHSRLKYGLIYSIGGMVSSLAFYQVNEILTGMLIRNRGKPQYFLTNTFAAMLVGSVAFGVLSIFRRGKTYQNFVDCQSHFLSLCIIGNIFDIQILMNRIGKTFIIEEQQPYEPYQPLKKMNLRKFIGDKFSKSNTEEIK